MKAGAVPDRVFYQRRALRQISLLPVVRGHWHAKALKALGDAVVEVLMEYQFPTDHIGDRLSRHVIDGGPEASGGDHDFRAFKRQRYRLPDPPEIIADRCHEIDIDANVAQLTRQIDGIGIGDFAKQDFGSDRYNLSVGVVWHSYS